MPRIWIMYLQSLIEQKLVDKTRHTFDRALCALPVTRHNLIWEQYLVFVSQKGVPIETSLRVYRRYLTYDPSCIEDFIEFLVNSCLWQEAAERLASILNDDNFESIKTKHRLWLELCALLSKHVTEISGLNVDAIIRCEIGKFSDEVGLLWAFLADYYTRRRLIEKARDTYEDGMRNVVTIRDFSIIFDAYTQFEECLLCVQMSDMSDSDDEDEDNDSERGEKFFDHDDDEEDKLNTAILRKNLENFWLFDFKDINLRMTRLKNLINRRPELENSVLLRG